MDKKTVYSPPLLTLNYVITEQAIAAGSMTVTPVQEGSFITEEYEQEEQSFNVGW